MSNKRQSSRSSNLSNKGYKSFSSSKPRIPTNIRILFNRMRKLNSTNTNHLSHDINSNLSRKLNLNTLNLHNSPASLNLPRRSSNTTNHRLSPLNQYSLLRPRLINQRTPSCPHPASQLKEISPLNPSRMSNLNRKALPRRRSRNLDSRRSTSPKLHINIPFRRCLRSQLLHLFRLPSLPPWPPQFPRPPRLQLYNRMVMSR